MPAVINPRRCRRLDRADRHLAEPPARPFVECPVTDHDLGCSGGNRHGRMMNGPACRAAAVADLPEERQFCYPQLAGHGDLGVAVHRERDHAVHVGWPEAGIVERGSDRLGGYPELTAARILGELGSSDARDRGSRSPAPAGHDLLSGTSITAVAMMWSPRLHLP